MQKLPYLRPHSSTINCYANYQSAFSDQFQVASEYGGRRRSSAYTQIITVIVFKCVSLSIDRVSVNFNVITKTTSYSLFFYIIIICPRIERFANWTFCVNSVHVFQMPLLHLTVRQQHLTAMIILLIYCLIIMTNVIIAVNSQLIIPHNNLLSTS